MLEAKQSRMTDCVSAQAPLQAEEVPDGMTRYMVTFRDLAAADVFVVAHSRAKARSIAYRVRGGPPVHAARTPDSGIVEWDPEGVPRDQWHFADTEPVAIIDGFVHDPVNHETSLQALLGEIHEALGDECPECDESIEATRGSMDDVFDHGRVTVRHARGTCTVPVTVNWTSEEGVFDNNV